MLELNITEFFNNESASNFSASQHELGIEAAKITWENAKECNASFVTEKNKQEFIDFFDSFGAWDDLEEWPVSELNALTIQYISGDIREFESFDSWGEYEKDETNSGRLFKTEDNQIYFMIGD